MFLRTPKSEAEHFYSKMSLSALAPKISESLQVPNKQSLTNEMDSGRSNDVKNVITFIGTKNSFKSASDQE
jgi:hypothetical protein